MNKNIDNDLLNQYENLTDLEKSSIMIYKSSLFYNINEISGIEDFINKSSFQIFKEIKNHNKFEYYYNKMQKNINLPSNLFMKLTIFKNIDFTDIYTFIDSMKNVYQNLELASLKITLPKSINTFRGVNCDDDFNINIAKGNIISTSSDLDIASKFLSGNIKNKIYKFDLEKGTHLLICPYSIVDVYDSEIDYLKSDTPKQMKIIKSDRQKEFIVFRNLSKFEFIGSKNIEDEELKNLEIEKYKVSSSISKLNINGLKKL